MKTQIIQLEVHDDLVSVRDKMGWGQAARIVLLWPIKQNFMSRRLDLLLLQRHSASLGAQLALVVSDPDVRYYAHQLKIPVFKTLRQAQSSQWRLGRKRFRLPERLRPRPDIELLRSQLQHESTAWYQSELARRSYYSLTLLVLIALAVVLVPGSQIGLTPKVQQQRLNLTVSASPSILAPSRSGELPALQEYVVVEGREAIGSTGKVMVPEKAAGGSVRFTNLTEKIVRIPEGTIVSTLGTSTQKPVRFKTTRAATISAGPGAYNSVPVLALNPGISGNQRANSLVAIEGSLGLNVSADNPSPTSGGSSRQTAGPAPADYRQLYDSLLEKLSQAALDEAVNGLPEGSFALPTTLAVVEVLEETFDPPPPGNGEVPIPTEELLLTLRVGFEVLTVSGEDLKATANSALDASLPTGYQSSNAQVQVEEISAPASEDGKTFRWRIRTSRMIYATIDHELASDLVRGRNLAETADLLTQRLPLESEPTIEISPSWWPRLPLLTGRIHLTIFTP